MTPIDRAAQALDGYNREDDDPRSNVVDLLTDLMYYCGMSAIDFSSALEIAEMHYECEGSPFRG